MVTRTSVHKSTLLSMEAVHMRISLSGSSAGGLTMSTFDIACRCALQKNFGTTCEAPGFCQS
jgi:hypothetical protein